MISICHERCNGSEADSHNTLCQIPSITYCTDTTTNSEITG
jgi:hypothetical protein